MAIILEHAILADIDPPRVEQGSLRIEDGKIVERGQSVTRGAGDETVDCRGAVVLPGLVNGHTHLYSALATGMPAPPKPPENFEQTLQYVWWRLDQALDAKSIEMSARIGALDALRCGTTTVIDHHASPGFIEDSLELIEEGLAAVGLRGVLCYETTDRHGPEGREAGLAENRRYLEKWQYQHSHKFAAMVCAHACFTLEEETLDALAELADAFVTGVHMHVAEDACDEEACQAQHQSFLIDLLVAHKLLRPASIFVHGVHLDHEAIARVGQAGLTLAHNPRSNMNNGVGYAPVGQYHCPVMLGTDGHLSDMFAEARFAWFAARHEHAGLTPNAVLAMLAAGARRASDPLDITLGKLQVDAAADIVLTDYRPATRLDSANLAGHFIFGMGAQHVRDVLVGGKWALRERVVVGCDEEAVRRRAVPLAADLWKRMESSQ
ncbi:MAG: amidohydrolase family protein [Planctomycetes bacterium]|nr:amidohydrolase family protein [Planctomycetota bacterium]